MRRTDDARIDRARKLLDDGLPTGDVARRLLVNPRTVRRIRSGQLRSRSKRPGRSHRRSGPVLIGQVLAELAGQIEPLGVDLVGEDRQRYEQIRKGPR